MNFAIFAKNAYEMVKCKNIDERIETINNNLKYLGYHIVRKYSNRDVQLYVNPDKLHAICSHRGSSFDSYKKCRVDLTSDIYFVAGIERHHKSFRKRCKKTCKIFKQLDEKYKIDLVGHSYAGSSILHTLIHNKIVRDRFNEAHLYNPLLSPVTKKVTDKTINELKNVFIHRINNDLASACYDKILYGTVKTYKQKEIFINNCSAFACQLFESVDLYKAHSINNFI